jgi:hypothetical protein
MSHDGTIWGKNESEDKRIDYEDRTQNTKKKKNTEKKTQKKKFIGLDKFWNLFGNSDLTFAIIYKF